MMLATLALEPASCLAIDPRVFRRDDAQAAAGRCAGAAPREREGARQEDREYCCTARSCHLRLRDRALFAGERVRSDW